MIFFLFFFFSLPPQTSNRCFVSRHRGSGRGDANGRKYNEVSREVIIDNNKANLELLTRTFSRAHNSLVFQLIPSFRLIDIRTRSALNVTIPLFPFSALPETKGFLSLSFLFARGYKVLKKKKSSRRRRRRNGCGTTGVCGWKHVCLLVLVSVCLYVSMWAVDLCA